MANRIKWTAWANESTVLTTQLNSLANGSRSNAGSEYDNATNKHQYGKLELQVTFGTNPDAGGYVTVYQVTAPDGTNYEDGSSSVDPGNHKIVDQIPVRATTSAQRLTSRAFALEPAKTKFILANSSGQAFPASGSTVTLYSADDEVQ